MEAQGMGQVARALLLLVVANAAPWAAARLPGRRWAAPLDCGCVLRDGQRLLGAHKTWRGLAVAVATGTIIAPWLGLSAAAGAAFGALAMLGDALSSGVKRRLALRPGTDVPGLDQLPEALLPLVALAGPLGLDVADILLATLLFLALNLLAVRLRRPCD